MRLRMIAEVVVLPALQLEQQNYFLLELSSAGIGRLTRASLPRECR